MSPSSAVDFASGLREAARVLRACRIRSELDEAAPDKAFFARWEESLEALYSSQTDVSSMTDEVRALRQEYIETYRAIVRAEHLLCAPASSTRVCQVGCGAMPLSLFLWHKYSGCSILGLDIVPEAVHGARRAFAARLEADRASYDPARVSFAAGDGALASYEGFDVVILSSTVRGKEAIFRRIAATAPSSVSVIERVPAGPWSRFASWEEHQPGAFELVKTVPVEILDIRLLVRREHGR